MKVRLLFPDRDASLETDLPAEAGMLVDDLDLTPLLDVMRPDRHGDQVCAAVLLQPLTNADHIRWRQAVLADVLAEPGPLRELFLLAGRARETQRGAAMYSGLSASSLLVKAVHGLRALLPLLRQLRMFAVNHRPSARSPGLSQLYRRLVEELDEPYLTQLSSLLEDLSAPNALTARARLTPAGVLGSLQLLAPRPDRRPWWAQWLTPVASEGDVTVADRDDLGMRALDAVRDDALYDVAVALARANSHVLGFFRQLQWETGFYLGCSRLHERLTDLGVEVCWPVPDTDGASLSATGLLSASLALRSGGRPVPGDLPGPGGGLVVVTGAHEGGKTTWLRAVGVAQLLLQAGVFVPATSFRSSLADRVHTHFRRGEDDELHSGKLEEELLRMSAIVDRCVPGDLLLMNESFASTDELGATHIATQLLDALIDHGIRVVLVTHFHSLARHYLEREWALFLVAERLPDGRRTHRLMPGRPQPLSDGRDLYERILGGTVR